MAVKIRLSRLGGKSRPYYRIVVADSTFPRNGRFLEIVGNYDPNKNPAEVNIKADRISDWIGKGAKPTTTVSHLLKKKGINAEA